MFPRSRLCITQLKAMYTIFVKERFVKERYFKYDTEAFLILEEN